MSLRRLIPRPPPPLFPRPHFIPTTSLWQPPQLPPLHHPPPSRHRIRQALSTLDVASALYDRRRWRHKRGRWRSHTSVGQGDGGAARGGGCCRTGEDTAVAPSLQKGRRSSAGVRSGRCTAVPLATGGGRCRRQGGGGGAGREGAWHALCSSTSRTPPSAGAQLCGWRNHQDFGRGQQASGRAAIARARAVRARTSLRAAQFAISAGRPGRRRHVLWPRSHNGNARLPVSEGTIFDFRRPNP